MVFPASGLPDRVTVRRAVPDGTDVDDNPKYRWATLISKRPARFYRDVPKEVPLVRAGVNVAAMVAFKFLPGDPYLDFKDEVLIEGPEFVKPARFGVVWVYPKMLWRTQSHWELAIGTEF